MASIRGHFKPLLKMKFIVTQDRDEKSSALYYISKPKTIIPMKSEFRFVKTSKSTEIGKNTTYKYLDVGVEKSEGIGIIAKRFINKLAKST